PYVTTQSLRYQFQKLVIEPLLESHNPAPAVQEQPLIPHQSRRSQPNNRTMGHAAEVGRSTRSLPSRTESVIVIDALDECNDKDQMADFIDIIITAFKVNHGLPIRVL